MNNQIQLYTSADGKISLQVSLDNETVWLTQAQMASLFGVKVQNITMHLKNVYAEQELDENSTCKDLLQVQTEGERTVSRKRKHYNLDAIISVGYRISSKRATQFRQWATQTAPKSSLALLVAESLPEQKELMIRLVEHFILLKG